MFFWKIFKEFYGRNKAIQNICPVGYISNRAGKGLSNYDFRCIGPLKSKIGDLS